jgi:hypothetical protein
VKRLADTDAFKRLQRQAEGEREKLIHASHLLGIYEPQRRSSAELRGAIRRRISEAEKVL